MRIGAKRTHYPLVPPQVASVLTFFVAVADGAVEVFVEVLVVPVDVLTVVEEGFTVEDVWTVEDVLIVEDEALVEEEAGFFRKS